MCGALFIWMSDWYGRTWHIFFGCLGICIGTIITSLSTTLPMLIGGRFLLSFFATWATTAAPLYLVEITPAAYRGTIAGLYNTFYYVVWHFRWSSLCATGHLLTILGLCSGYLRRLWMPQTHQQKWQPRLAYPPLASACLSRNCGHLHQVLSRVAKMVTNVLDQEEKGNNANMN